MSESQFQEMLQTRSGNRPNSFYKKLLRKLKLAKKTDVSSGIAVIDITEEDDDENEKQSKRNPQNDKRKHIECQEIEDNDDDDVSSPKRRFVFESSGLNGVELGCGHYLPLYSFPPGKPRENELNKFGSRGESCSVPILIDDESDEDEDVDMANDSNSNVIETNSDEEPANVQTVASTDIAKQNDPSKDIQVIDSSNIQPTNTGESNELSHNSNIEIDTTKLEYPIEKKSRCDEALVNKAENVNTDNDESDDNEDLEMADDSHNNIKETNSGEKHTNKKTVTSTDIVKQNSSSKDSQVIGNSNIQPLTDTGESNKLSHNSNFESDTTKLENPIEKKSPHDEALVNKAENVNTDNDESDGDKDLEMADGSNSNIKETNPGDKPTNKKTVTSTDIGKVNHPSKDIQAIDNSNIQPSANTGESNELLHDSNLEVDATKLENPIEKKSPHDDVFVNKAENVVTDESYSEMNTCDNTGVKRDDDCLPDMNTLKENDKSELPVKNNKKENKKGEILATSNDFTDSFESKEECTDNNAFLNNTDKNNEMCKDEASCIKEPEDSVAVENEDVGSVINDIEDVNDNTDEDDQNEDCKDEELEDECDDEIEFLSEDIRCMMTYGKIVCTFL